MTLDQLQRRDARIAMLEALGRDRTRTQDHEFGALVNARDHFWRRMGAQHARARRRAADLAAYARQHGLRLDDGAPA